MRAFTKSVLIITIFAATTRAIGFIFRIFLSRVLGAEMLGIYQMAMSIFMVLLTVISSGLPLVLSREIAKADKSAVRAMTRAGCIIGITVSVIICAAVLAFQNIFGLFFADARSLPLLLALLPAIIASALYCVLRAVWWGQKRFVLLGATELVEQVLRVLLFVVALNFITVFADLAAMSAWSFSGACVISALAVLVIFLFTNKKTAQPAAAINYTKPLLKSALPITGVRVVSSVAFPLISIILPLRLVAAGWATATAVAHFGIIIGMMFPLLTIPSTIISALATALVPELSATTKQAQIQNQIKKSINFTIFINFVFIPIFIALGPPLGEFLFANADSGIYLARSAWAMVPLSLSQITSAVLNSLGQEKLAMRNYFIGSVALLASIWFLPAIIGADAVVVGLGISTAIAVILNVHAIRRITGANISILPRVFAFTLVALPTLVTAYFTHNIIRLPQIITLPIAGLLALLIFVALSASFNLVKIKLKK